MALTRRIARPLLATTFIVDGIDSVRNPGSKAKSALPVVVPITRRFPALPDDPERLVQINGAVQVAAGVLLSMGRCRRMAALALIGSVLPTTIARHRFWEEEDPTLRAGQRVLFLKNVGLLGGLILAAVDTEGEPSLGWRARRRAAVIATAIGIERSAGSASAMQAGHTVLDGASAIMRNAQDVATEAGRHLDEGSSVVAHHAQDMANWAARQAGAKGQQLVDSAPGASRQLSETLSSAGHQAVNSVSRAAASGVEFAAPSIATGAARAGEFVARVQGHIDN